MVQKYVAGSLHTMEFPEKQAVSLDLEALDNLVLSQGVPLVHWRAMRCPIGMADQSDNRRVHADHSNCSNGYIYTRAGVAIGFFLSNAKSNKETAVGPLDAAGVRTTLTRFYQDEANAGQPIYIAPFDRLYLEDSSIVVPTWETFEMDLTGKTKLHYPAVKVQDLVDSQGRFYQEGVHFTIEKGCLIWGEDRPGMDPILNKGFICSVRYLYQPYWYAADLGHEIRVTQTEDELTGDRTVKRINQEIRLQREYFFENQEFSQEQPDNPRSIPVPKDGSFGPR